MGIINSIRHRSVVRHTIVASLVLLSLVAATVPVQAATLLSQTTWGGLDSDVTAGVAVAADGSTYLVGMTRNFGTNPTNIFVVKFATDGSLVWQRTWSGPAAFVGDEATDVAIGPDGAVYVTGTTLGVGGDVVLLKFTPDGTLVWQRRWGGGANDRPAALAVAADGAVYVTGVTTSFKANDSDLFIVKFTPDGALAWEQTWGTGGYEEGQGIAVEPGGNVYVAGVASRPDGSFAWDAVLLKLDAAGALVWQRAYFAAEITDARGGVAVAPDGAVYLAGTIQEPALDAIVLKFAPDGALVWQRAWGGRDGDAVDDVAVAPDGTVLLAGSTSSFGVGGGDAFLVRVQPSGRALDATTWGGVGLDNGQGVGVAPDGTVALGATAASPPYSALRAPSKTSRLRGTLAAPTTSLVGVVGTVADPAGVVGEPNGSTSYAGGFDAALVRMAP